MIIKTLSTDASISMELGHRIAMTERRRRQGRSSLSAMWSRLFLRQPAAVKLVRAHA